MQTQNGEGYYVRHQIRISTGYVKKVSFMFFFFLSLPSYLDFWNCRLEDIDIYYGSVKCEKNDEN